MADERSESELALATDETSSRHRPPPIGHQWNVFASKMAGYESDEYSLPLLRRGYKIQLDSDSDDEELIPELRVRDDFSDSDSEFFPNSDSDDDSLPTLLDPNEIVDSDSDSDDDEVTVLFDSQEVTRDREFSDNEDHNRNQSPVRVVRGVHRFDNKHDCVIFGEEGLEWLFSLRPRDWSRIRWIPHHGEVTLFPELAKQYGSILEYATWEDVVAHPPEIWLGAGINTELEAQLANIPTGAPVILTTAIARGRSKSRFNWRSIAHHDIGGVTALQVRVGTSGWDLRKKLPRSVRRNVSHIIEHKERAKACSATVTEASLAHDALLDWDNYTLPVVYPTHSTCTNWGKRLLTPTELGVGFDLPLWVLNSSLLLHCWQEKLAQRSVHPLKVHQTVLDAYLGWKNRQTPRSLKAPPPSPPTPMAEDPPAEHFFFTGITTGLPSTWTSEGTVTTKAVKADDAAVNTSLWDARIQLVLGGTADQLNTIRKGALCWWRRTVFRSYVRSLRRDFGENWCEDMLLARRRRAAASAAVASTNSKAPVDPAAKARNTGGLKRSSTVRPGSNMPATMAGNFSGGASDGAAKRQRRGSPSAGRKQSKHSKLPNSAVRKSLLKATPAFVTLNKLPRHEAPSGEGFDLGQSPSTLNGGSQSPHGNSSLTKDERLLEEVGKGIDVLDQVINTQSWWDWDNGSALLYWRWCTVRQREAARDGMQIFVRDKLPTSRRPARPPVKGQRKLIATKINKVRKRRYIRRGVVKNLTDYFAVPKGDSDIRMVYNGTSSGLNDALWAPSFYMPVSNSVSRLLTYYTFCADLDLGEMFLNFPMDPAIRPYAGVDLTHLKLFLDDVELYKGTGNWLKIVERWERLFMGMKPSPYNAVRYFYWAEEFARGNPQDPANALRYDRIIMNLPGMENHDPSEPSVMKWNDDMERLAGDVATFIDDLRTLGFDVENNWQVSRQVASRLQYLGIQNAPRKTRPPSQEPGAWAGCIHKITPGESISRSVAQEKWDKAKWIIDEVTSILEANPQADAVRFSHKMLEKMRGFLVHLAMTFPEINPFLKGWHLTIDHWRPQRGEDGWKMTNREWRVAQQHLAEKGKLTEDDVDAADSDAPEFVWSVPRFRDDMKALQLFFSRPEPPEFVLRSKKVAVVIYGLGDASGKGFGSSFTMNGGISYRIGVWAEEESDESSNWREFTNVVESLEEEAASGRLRNTAVYFFTDNFTVESAVHKGTSSSKKLLGLVIRLLALQLMYGIVLIVSHVSGKRMIASGGDGISRGLLNEGVMAGTPMLAFLPLHKSALERSDTLLDWIKTWAGDELTALTPYDWFQRGHDITGWEKEEGSLFFQPTLESGIYVWSPPPAAADVALEQLRIARIKRQDSTHIFICPRLLQPLWRKQIHKAADIVFMVPTGAPGTNHGNFGAPLKCMQLEGTCIECGKRLTWTQGLFCANFGALLGPFSKCQRVWCPGCYTSKTSGLEFHIAQREANQELLAGSDRDGDRMTNVWRISNEAQGIYEVARKGDHLMVQFECDLCVFHKLKRRNPFQGSHQDDLLLGCIRRVIMDAFWSRAASTVKNQATKVEQGIRLSKRVGLDGPYLEQGPLPYYDHCGYEVAIQMVLQSREAGKHSGKYQQWDTIRKLRTAYSNQVRAAAVANRSALSIGDDAGKSYMRIGEDPCASLWFQRFTIGCRRRMGQDWRPDKAISTELLLAVLEVIEVNIKEEQDPVMKRMWITAGAYFTICYVVSLRGNEGLLLDLGALRQHFDTGADEYVIIPLLGTVKGEHNVRQHLIPCVNVTSSGIKVRELLGRLLNLEYRSGRTKGPAICGDNGTALHGRVLNDMFHEALEKVYEDEDQRKLFSAEITKICDIGDKFNVFRSFRRGSASRAIAQNVSAIDIDVVNRWKRKEAAGTSKASMQMKQHYADVSLLLPSFLRYTSSM